MSYFARKWSSKENRFFYGLYLAVIVVFLSVFSLIYFYRATSAKYLISVTQLDGSEKSMDVRVFEGLKVKSFDKENDAQISLSDSDHTLVILISAGDCPSCLRENEVYKRLAEKYSSKQLRIIFLIVRSTEDEAKTLIKAFNFPSEVYFDGQSVGGKTALPAALPFKVLFKRDEGVAMVDGPNPTKELQNQFRQKLEAYLTEVNTLQ